MAAEAPDPKSFKSWDEAFQYPVPAVRRMEQQLRGDLTANRDRLRMLVGASYRDLLGTAERIIQMDGDMQSVETQLGSISRRCNSRMVEKVGSSFRRWDKASRTEDHQRYAFASQLAILQSCPLVISRILREGGSILLAAKVLVLSRHVHKALSHFEDAPPLLEKLKIRIGSLRARLLRHIDSQFSSSTASRSTLVDTMCAYSLATSSTPNDVLRHFHHIRSDAILNQLESSQDRHESVLRALRLYLRTLQDTQSLLPKSLGDALLKLRSQPLRKDASLRALVELNIDIHEQWVSSDVKNFTPWIRHDDLSQSEVNDVLKKWATKTFAALLERLRKLLGEIDDFSILVRVRTESLRLWFLAERDVASFTSARTIQDLRSAINDQLVRLIRGSASRLRVVCADILESLQDCEEDELEASEGLWTTSTELTELGNGATDFKQMILDRLQGRTVRITQAINGYTTWLGLLDEVFAIIRELRSQKWNDDLDDYEDEAGLDSRNAQLSEDDPKMLEEECDAAISTSFEKFESALTEQIEPSASDLSGPQVIFLLRVLREIRQKLPQHGTILNFGLSVVPSLHKILAEKASSQQLRSFEVSFRKGTWMKRASSRGLWEGSPPLPVLPSPRLFKFLHGLNANMATYGSDVWSPDARKRLKAAVAQGLAKLFQEVIKARQDEKVVNGDVQSEGANTVSTVNGDGEESSEGKHEPRPITKSPNQGDYEMQLLFDVLFLRGLLESDGSPGVGEGLGSIQEDLSRKVHLGDLSERLKKGVQDYQKRTTLLFALVA